MWRLFLIQTISNMCNSQLLNNSELIEIEINASVSKYSFPQNLNIVEKDAEVIAVEAYSSDEIPLAPSGRAVVSATEVKALFLSLRRKELNDYPMRRTPFIDLIAAKQNGQKEFIQPMQVDFSQSEIEVSQTVSLPTTKSILIRVIYRKTNVCK
jgi:hypothetical protein